MSGIIAAFAGVGGLPLSAVAAPSSVSGVGDGLSAQTVTSNGSTATASNGSGTYTYSWTYVSGDSGIAATTPTSSFTVWHKALAIGASVAAVWKCTVTDTVTGQTAVTNNVNISLTN